jgi:hypothetical protein
MTCASAANPPLVSLGPPSAGVDRQTFLAEHDVKNRPPDVVFAISVLQHIDVILRCDETDEPTTFVRALNKSAPEALLPARLSGPFDLEPPRLTEGGQDITFDPSATCRGPWSVASRPLDGEAPTIDLVIRNNKTNTSPILGLFLSRLDQLKKRAPQTH